MKEQLQKDFDNTIKNLTLSQRDIEIKKFYLDNFINKGFPNRKEEDWKFSDLNQIIKKNIGEISFYSDYTSTNKVETFTTKNEVEALLLEQSLIKENKQALILIPEIFLTSQFKKRFELFILETLLFINAKDLKILKSIIFEN